MTREEELKLLAQLDALSVKVAELWQAAYRLGLIGPRVRPGDGSGAPEIEK